MQARRLLVFGVAGQLCACALEAVREIVPSREITRLPGAPAWVSGLINLRGTLLTVVNLATRLGASGPDADVRLIVVAEAAGKSFGIGVSEVRDVEEVAAGGIEMVDAARAAGGIVCGLVRTAGPRQEAALVCDLDALAHEALAL